MFAKLKKILLFLLCLLLSVQSVFAACGDGNKEMTEACDDGNLTNGDGCDDMCEIEYWYSCEVPEVNFDGLSQADVDGAGTRVPDADGLGITETQNTAPGIVNIEPDAMNNLYKLKFGVLTASDDDMIGIALGYNQWEFNNATSYDYLLYDRKQTDQFYNGNTAFEWTRLWLVKWSWALSFTDYRHFDSPVWNGVTEFTRGATYWNVWRADNTLYDLDVLYTASSLKIWINGVLDIDITPAAFPLEFPSGQFPVWWIGFYSISQAQARFEIVPQVTSFCQIACGDQVLHTPTEECDDGNSDPNDGCSSLCEREYCRDDAPLNNTSKNFVVTSLASWSISGTSTQANAKVAICLEDTTGTRDVFYTSTDTSWSFTYTPNLAPYTAPWVNVGVMLHDENDLDIDHHALVLMR